MKFTAKLVAGGAALFAGTSMLTAPASAEIIGPMGTSGYGEIFGLHMFDSEYEGNNGFEDFDPQYTGLGAGGHVNFWLNDRWTLQLDGLGNFWRNYDNRQGRPDYRMFAVEGLAHIGWRDPDQGYLGAFGGLLSFGYSSGPRDNSFDQWVIGGEGAVYLDNMTLFAQAGFMDSWSEDTNGNGPDDSYTDTWFVRGGIKYFVNPNLKLEASGGLLQGNEYATDEPALGCCRVDMPFWQVEAEYKPEDSRVSWFGSYGGYHENEVGFAHTTHTIMAGMRIHFGQDSLQSVDRTGASLDFFDTKMLSTAYDH